MEKEHLSRRPNIIRGIILAVFSLVLAACTGIPQGATPVMGFDVQRYLGTWYEVARLDHSFERGLSNVRARYSLRDDGGIRVLNSGYDQEKGAWSEAEGKAYFVENPDTGRLKVSFFGPFYGAYNIIELDEENYEYALVVGNTTSYMWILARTPEIESEILERLLEKAARLGFATDQLIYPSHAMAGE